MAKIYVAITGGIGSGKSLVLQFLREMKFPVFSCDELYKQVIVSKEYIEKIEKLFPNAIKAGQIDRAKLSEIVFSDEEKRKQLNSLAHPLIIDLLLQNMKEAEGDIAFAEVPLLFEGNFENLFDNVIYITRERSQRVAAILQRDNISIEEAEKRIASQFDGTTEEGQKRLKNCNAKIIFNDKSKEELKREIFEIISHL